MNNYKIISTTTDSKDTSDIIKKTLLSKKISPCIHEIKNILSSYIWKGKVLDEKEILLLIKTTEKNSPAVIDTILNLHNYENPEIISYDFNIVSDLYLKWFDKTLKQ